MIKKSGPKDVHGASITSKVIKLTVILLIYQLILLFSFLQGLDKTKKKNFEGGDVAWEEKKLGKYKTSETRLVEILESYACTKDNHKCNSLLEEKEESIYEWYNKL